MSKNSLAEEVLINGVDGESQGILFLGNEVIMFCLEPYAVLCEALS